MSDFLDKAQDLAGDVEDRIRDGVDKATELAVPEEVDGAVAALDEPAEG